MHTGSGMAVCGFILGAAAFLGTRGVQPGRLGSYSRGKYDGAKLLRVPFLLLGVVGVVLIIVGELR